MFNGFRSLVCSESRSCILADLLANASSRHLAVFLHVSLKFGHSEFGGSIGRLGKQAGAELGQAQQQLAQVDQKF